MYIFKNPFNGLEVPMHKDTSFLVTYPDNVMGIWMGLDDSFQGNGCMRGVPGSHKTGPNIKHKRAYDHTIGQYINAPHILSEE